MAEIFNEDVERLLCLLWISTADMTDRDQAVVQKMRLNLRQQDIKLEALILRFLNVISLRLITDNEDQHEDCCDDRTQRDQMDA